MCFTKYNEEGTNNLSVLCVNDNDDCKFGKGGRTESRKRLKSDRNEVRDIETGTSPFVARGLTIGSRMEIIELAQFEDSKVREDLQSRLTQLNVRSDLLLRERSQQIDLAKIICPVYNKTDSNWMEVISLTEDIQVVKDQLRVVEEERAIISEQNKSTQLANQFIESICVQEMPMKNITNKSDKVDVVRCEQLDDDDDEDTIDLDDIGDKSRILDMDKDADDVL